MALYHPVLLGEAAGLRIETESFLSGDQPDAINDRIAELDQKVTAAGMWATFGAEVELQFVPDPSQPDRVRERNKERLYEQVVQGVRGYTRGQAWPKGRIIRPVQNPGPIMHNQLDNGTYNSDQRGSDIIEVRTSPEHAIISTDRYWDVIDSVGTVAARHGYMGLILATHISSAVMIDRGRGITSVDFTHRNSGGRLMAVTQHNLQAMQPLQLNAGLGSGFAYLEAFPSKDGTTAIHPTRLENRHPTTAIADPRIYTLATLAAITQIIDGTAPENALRHLREGQKVNLYAKEGPGLSALETLTVWDPRARRLVMPAQLQKSARSEWFDIDAGQLVATATGEHDTHYMDDNARVLRAIAAAVRIKGGHEIYIDPSCPYAQQLQPLAAYTEFLPATPLMRTVPTAEFDSPEVHALRRQRVTGSRIVRSVFGKAIQSIAPANEALERRQALVNGQMIVSEGDDLE